jgi:hypothetical protein
VAESRLGEPGKLGRLEARGERLLGGGPRGVVADGDGCQLQRAADSGSSVAPRRPPATGLPRGPVAQVGEGKPLGPPGAVRGPPPPGCVSNWLVHAEGVREHVEAARKGQAGRTAREQRAGTTASTASLATDLEITRAELRRTRDERDRLKAKVQRGLGHQVTQAGTAELATRIKDLTARLEQQDTELAQARAAITGLASERDAALDEIAGSGQHCGR